MESLKNELTSLGFSDKEALVYLGSLQLGLATAQEIGKKSGINRATTYVLIDSLIKKGLMSSFVKDGKKFFVAESPHKLISLLHLQKKELEEKERELTAALPQLLAIYNVEGDKPKIRYLEGFEGVASVAKYFEDQEGEFVQIVSLDEVEKVKHFFQYRHRHIEELSRRAVPNRLLAVMAEPDFARIPVIPGAVVRLISSEKFPLRGDISVRGNAVFIYSFQEKMIGIVITSADIANTIRQLFNLAWEGSSGYPTEKR